jgi:acetylglutamate kinase
VAAEVAVALGAAKLILMTDVPGIMDGKQAVISELKEPEARDMLSRGAVSGGMIPKLEACLRALDGVPLAHVIDGRTPHSLLLELFTEAGIGTMVTP